MRNKVIWPRPRRVPFIPLAAPFETVISGFADDEADEILDDELFIYKISRIANENSDIEVGASPELARQINAYFGQNVVYSDELERGDRNE